jgi:hypothetical protein
VLFRIIIYWSGAKGAHLRDLKLNKNIKLIYKSSGPLQIQSTATLETKNVYLRCLATSISSGKAKLIKLVQLDKIMNSQKFFSGTQSFVM